MFLAETASGAPSFDVTSILQFGLLGLIFLCVVFRRFIVPEWTLTLAEAHGKAEKAALEERVAELQQQVTRLQTAYQDLIIPALTRSTEINATYLEELRRIRISRSD